ncbi:hypothetical protein ACGFNV_24535 [Streptomyces sp. NPDC048751]|uniref:hypothetical protein n=1 Tax=Streptomyces sp. NPDC048751 TaxID=3365591 RepID=UPI003715D28C
MKHPVRTAAVLLGLLTLLALTTPARAATAAPAADGQPTPKKNSGPTLGVLTPDQFYGELGITGVRTRYVVLVDTAYLRGMPLRETRTQLTTLLDAMSGKDEITLILFDREVRRTIPRLTREDVEGLSAPGPPSTDYTIDLPRALNAALTTLKSDLPQRSAIAVLAAGEQTTPRPDSVDALGSRADALRLRTRLTVHLFPLSGYDGNRTGHLEVLARAFPSSLITNSWRPWERPDLAQVREDVLRRAAITALAVERSGRVVVEWPEKPVRLSPKDGKATVTLTLRSTMKTVPLWISGLRFTIDDGSVPITATVPSDKYISGDELKPGAAAQVTVELTWKSDQYATERRTVRLTGSLSVHAEVSTRWQPNLTALGIRTIPPPLDARSITVSGTGQVGIPAWVVPAVGAGAVGLVLVWVVRAVRRRARRRPRMHGWLVARILDEGAQGTVTSELGPVPLAGQRSLCTDRLLPPGEGLIHVSPECDDRGAVAAFLIVYESCDPQMPDDDGVCRIDDGVVIKGVEFVHMVRQPSRPVARPEEHHGV